MKKIVLSFLLLFLFLNTRAEEKTITTSDGVKLHISVKGTGAPCLYVHGGPGSGSYWFEKFFGEFMESKYTMIYLDQRGVGRSGGTFEDDYSIERMAKDFEEIREALGYENWFTVGHSFGGVLQMGYYELFPQAINGMLMINCTLDLKTSFCESWGPKAAEFTGTISSTPCDTPDNIRNILGNHIQNLREKELFWKMGYQIKENEKIMDATYNDIENWNSSFGNQALNVEDYWKDYRPLTYNVQVPVLFFYGEQDWMVGPKHYEQIFFPNQMLVKTTGGHMPFMENQEELMEAITAFHSKYTI